MNAYKVTVFEQVTSVVEYQLVRQADSAEAVRELVLDEYYNGMPPEDWEVRSDETEDCELLTKDMIVQRLEAA